MLTHPFDSLSVSQGNLFPPDIQEDPWILFHGTHMYRDSSIEARGLCPNQCIITKSEVSQICTLSEKTHFFGDDRSGLEVLRSYARHDQRSGVKPVFLSYTACRCLLYASRDFAGGETVRAVRVGIRNLRQYGAYRSLRREAERKRWISFLDRFGISGDLGIESLEAAPDADVQSAICKAYPHHYERILTDLPKRTNYAEVKREIEALSPIYDRCEQLVGTLECGVVYAIRLDRSDLNDFVDRGSGHGVEAYRSIALGEIIAKVEIPFFGPQVPCANERENEETAFRIHHGIVPLLKKS